MLTRIGFGLAVDCDQFTQRGGKIHLEMRIPRLDGRLDPPWTVQELDGTYDRCARMVQIAISSKLFSSLVGAGQGGTSLHSEILSCPFSVLLQDDDVRSNLREAISEKLGTDIAVRYLVLQTA